jgi:hypothetical protein
MTSKTRLTLLKEVFWNVIKEQALSMYLPNLDLDDPSAAKNGEGTKSGAGLSKSRETTGNRKWIGSTGIHRNKYTKNSES